MSDLGAYKVYGSQDIYRVLACPRCGGKHCVSVSPLDGEPVMSTAGEPYTLWALCESTGQPILFRKFNVIELAERGCFDG